ncbi:MAG: hypothetical protein LBF71_00555 [Campylobacteraceae bacterium]|jgi:hypothetical protein|nr:hypothetical protein [Campylobacteraceae bacterium]
MAAKYLDDVKEVFETLWDSASGKLEGEFKRYGFKREEFIKYVAEAMNNILENAVKYPLQLKQMELIEKQIEEADQLLPEKRALAKAQVASEFTKAMLTLKQMLAYDDNIYAKTAETQGQMLGMVLAGNVEIDAEKWSSFAASLNDLKNRSMSDDERILQLKDKVREITLETAPTQPEP